MRAAAGEWAAVLAAESVAVVVGQVGLEIAADSAVIDSIADPVHWGLLCEKAAGFVVGLSADFEHFEDSAGQSGLGCSAESWHAA